MRCCIAGALALALCVGLASAESPFRSPDIDLGKRMYRDGLLPSGEPMRATLQGDIPVVGTQLNCATCHRWSGFGSSEGAAFVPPITGPTLYQARQLDRAELFRKLYQEVQPKRFQARARDPRLRPAYTDDTLAMVLRQGTDPSGRVLDPLMPRYHLNDEEMGHLIAYLKSLSATPAPGVDKSTIHFATVVTEGAEPAERRAMLNVMHTFVHHKNATTRSLFQRPGHSPWHHNEFFRAYREWALHVWELRGPPPTWPAQLIRYYRNQPVFALLSGIGVGEWQPVHAFCEAVEVPCLFPHTDVPVVEPPGAYALYFSKGLRGEAEALARYLRETHWSATTTPVMQVYRDVTAGRIPAQALRHALQGFGSVRVQDSIIEATQHLTPAFWKQLFQGIPPAHLVLWLNDAEVETLAAAPNALRGVRKLYLSYSQLNKTLPFLPQHLSDKTYFTYPFALPGRPIPRLYRVRAWMRSRRIALTHERMQLNTYFVLSLVDHALMHLVENFSRDYFIESVEHETENALNPGVFPHLSLGPGQRFASKGSYIVKLSPSAPGGLKAVSEWIVP